MASDPLVVHGVARVLEHAGAIESAELHGTLEAALTGPAVALVIVHPDTPDLTAARAAALVERRHAMALLAAGAGQGSGIAALRSAGARGVLTGAEAPVLCARMIELVLAGGSCWTAAPAPRSATMDQGICADRDSIPLTPRQWEVAGELVQGRANKVSMLNGASSKRLDENSPVNPAVHGLAATSVGRCLGGRPRRRGAAAAG